MRKRTHSEYINQLSIKNNNLMVIDNYIDANTKIKHYCKKHNVYFDTTPARALSGVGCEICKNEKIRNIKQMSNDVFISKLNAINPNIIPMQSYVGIQIPILFLCREHNTNFETTPDIVLKGCGCSKCRSDKISNKNTKSYNVFLDELFNINPNIKHIGEYKKSTIKTKFKCLICNYEWEAIPSQILNGSGCPKCGGKMKYTNEEYKKIALKNNIEVMEEYINMKTPITHRCIIHNYIYKVTPASVIHSKGCKYCAFERIAKAQKDKGLSHNEYVNLLYSINNKIKVLDQYKNNHTPIKHKCLVCGTIWSAYPTNILRGSGCPKCNCNSSKGEVRISKWLETKGISFEVQKRFDNCRNKKPLPFDFYIPQYNCVIEFDGKQHSEPIEYFGGKEEFYKLKKRDMIKNDYCKKNGIKLIRISWNENIEDILSKSLI